MDNVGKNIAAIEIVANNIDPASFVVETTAEYHRECPTLNKSE